MNTVPYLPVLDIVTIHFQNTQIRMGIWGVCYYDSKNQKNCPKPLEFGQPYNVTITQGGTSQVIIQGWTRVLVYHIVSAVSTSFAFFLVVVSLYYPVKSRVVPLAAVVLAFAFLTTLQSLTIDIMTFFVVKSVVQAVGTGNKTDFGPALWINLSSFVLFIPTIFIFVRERWFKG